jgi:type II secretory pathway pseudopilin PulG
MIRGGAVHGYTILETMIFLAITSLLFGSFVSVFGGRQGEVQFTQSTRDAQIQVQAIINEVSSGFYPSNSANTCTVGAGASAVPTFVATPSVQGTSNQCVFIGKAMQLGGASAKDITVISLAARRLNSLNKEASSLREALVTAIPGINVSSRLQYELYVTRIVVPSVTGQAFGSIVFLTTLPKFQGSTGTLASGAQRVSFGAVPQTAIGNDVTAATSAVNNLTDLTDPSPGSRQPITINPASGIYICLADNQNVASARRKAMIVIGEGASQTTARLETGNYRADICG